MAKVVCDEVDVGGSCEVCFWVTPYGASLIDVATAVGKHLADNPSHTVRVERVQVWRTEG
jgi:hypothetical protein